MDKLPKEILHLTAFFGAIAGVIIALVMDSSESDSLFKHWIASLMFGFAIVYVVAVPFFYFKFGYRACSGLEMVLNFTAMFVLSLSLFLDVGLLWMLFESTPFYEHTKLIAFVLACIWGFNYARGLCRGSSSKSN